MQALALIVLTMPALGQSPASNPLDMRITDIQGSATLFTANGPQEGTQAQADTPLEPGDRIKTGAEGRVELGIDGDSVVDIGPNSDFTVTSLERKTPAFDLGLGTLLAKIRTGLFGDGGALEVRTPTAVAAVRGTEFGVEMTTDQGASVGVFDEGQVSVRGSAGGQEVFLRPNQETSVFRGQPPQAVHPLRRFRAHRARLAMMRRRIAVLRRRWRALPAARRRMLRRRVMQRRNNMRQRRPIRAREKQRRREERP